MIMVKTVQKKTINKSFYKKLYTLFTKKNKKIKTSLPPSLSTLHLTLSVYSSLK